MTVCWDVTYDAAAPAAPPPQPAPPERPSAAPSGSLWLSVLEAEVIAVLSADGWKTTPEIVELLGHDPSDLRVVLRNMGPPPGRNILECDRRGFRLRQPPPTTSAP